jgi:two-component system, NarL family, nitrate/nitrite response regulator NarL
MKIIVHLTNRLMSEAVKSLLTVNGYEHVSLDLHAFPRPDVILVDVLAIDDAAALYPHTKLLLLNIGVENEQIIKDLPGYKLFGILSPQSGVESLQKALREINTGNIFTDGHGLKAIRDPKGARDTDNALGITNREQQIIDLVVQGYSNKEIGDRLSITEKAVKYHLRAIFLKLHVPNRAKLTSFIINKAHIEARRRKKATKSVLTRSIKSSGAAIDRLRRYLPII